MGFVSRLLAGLLSAFQVFLYAILSVLTVLIRGKREILSFNLLGSRSYSKNFFINAFLFNI
jgi:hypothetical protein